jgi:drug/metabolite transporter (DMT)-like permease
MTTLANAGSGVLGRYVNRSQRWHPLVVTAVSMGVGGLLLLTVGMSTQGLPPLGVSGWAIIGWLAVVITALSFTLWNRTLRILMAMESSLINNTMLVQIAILAWLFLGERHNAQALAGLGLAALGALLVQLRSRFRNASSNLEGGSDVESRMGSACAVSGRTDETNARRAAEDRLSSERREIR